MFTVELNKINMDTVAKTMSVCKAQSLVHWILEPR